VDLYVDCFLCPHSDHKDRLLHLACRKLVKDTKVQNFSLLNFLNLAAKLSVDAHIYSDAISRDRIFG